MRILKRSPTPKLGDRRPKVWGILWLNSLAVLVVPEIDLKRWSREKEYLAFDGEKFTISWVTNKHLCLLLFEVLMLIDSDVANVGRSINKKREKRQPF